MPHRPDDQQYPHLEFMREERSAERRRQRGFSNAKPDRGNRQTFGAQLTEAADRLTAQQERKPPPPPGIKPHLVFRVPLAPKTSLKKVTDLFEQTGLLIVSVESDGAVVAFRDDTDLDEFRQAIVKYQNGPSRNLSTGQVQATSKYDILEFLEAQEMRLWGRSDRIGPRLATQIGSDGTQIDYATMYRVDVELWHPGTTPSARQQMTELEQFVAYEALDNERVLDRYIGPTLILAKIAITGSRLERLLDFDSVAEIDLPPIASFEPVSARNVTADDFPSPPHPPTDGPRVCIIDSGIVSNHPLLAPYVGHAEAVLTQAESPADINGHGTMVGALAVFGDVRACYEERSFVSSITLFSARVLNERNEFDDEKLIINQFRQAIETFMSPPHNCRIFNISIGGYTPGLDTHTRRQNRWAEALDLLAHELKVLLVVAAGNHAEAIAFNAEDAEAILRDYPALLLRPAARLNDFATAAIPITVGALAQHDAIAVRRPPYDNDIVCIIAKADEPSPMTRSGPGIQGAIKPEFVHYGGSMIFDRGAARKIHSDEGTAVMSFSHEPTERLFAYDIGTSFAAPRIARLAALVQHQLQQELTETPHPNLVRAILATSAAIPEAAQKRLNQLSRLDKHAAIKICGYGLPEEGLALRSSDRRVTLYAQSQLPLDHFHIYRIPIPETFLQAAGTRSITVALAFDPPVRGRRLDYLGVEMNMYLIRGKSFEEVHNAYRKSGPGEDAEKALEDRYRISLEPARSRKKSTLQCGTFTMRRTRAKNYGNEYWLVILAERKWAPPEIEQQDYAVAVTLTADDPDLYVQIRQRIRSRVRLQL